MKKNIINYLKNIILFFYPSYDEIDLINLIKFVIERIEDFFYGLVLPLLIFYGLLFLGYIFWYQCSLPDSEYKWIIDQIEVYMLTWKEYFEDLYYYSLYYFWLFQLKLWLITIKVLNFLSSIYLTDEQRFLLLCILFIIGLGLYMRK